MKYGTTGRIMILISALIVVRIFTTCKKSEVTPSQDPIVTTSAATFVGQKWATLKGTVNARNQICKVSFEYDTTTSYKFNIKATPDSITGNIVNTVGAELTGLIPNTKYYYRTKVISSSLTLYGTELTFTTTNPGRSAINFNPAKTYGLVMDIDNNVYKTILIGTQIWMAENLKATKYNDGSVIPYVPDESIWTGLSSPGYSWYNNDSVAYGALYNWYAVSNKNICPAGWHVPSDNEWSTLASYLGGESTAGSKLKESGTTHWLTSTVGSSNESGFTALPGGYRSNAGTFKSIRQYGYWWSSTESSSVNSFCRYIFYSFDNLGRSDSNYTSGFSVRCLKD